MFMMFGVLDKWLAWFGRRMHPHSCDTNTNTELSNPTPIAHNYNSLLGSHFVRTCFSLQSMDFIVSMESSDRLLMESMDREVHDCMDPQHGLHEKIASMKSINDSRSSIGYYVRHILRSKSLQNNIRRISRISGARLFDIFDFQILRIPQHICSENGCCVCLCFLNSLVYSKSRIICAGGHEHVH